MEEVEYTPEDAKKFKAMGDKQIVTDDLDNFGKAENTKAVQEVAERENTALKAYEKAKTGDFSELDESEQESLIRYSVAHGREDAKEEAVKATKKIKTGKLDIRAISSELVAEELGTDAKYTSRFASAEAEAYDAMNERLRQKDEMDKIDILKGDRDK